MTDDRGRPCVMLLTPGNTSDYRAAQQCLSAMPPVSHVIADKGYDSDDLRSWLTARGTTPVIPPRSNRKVQHAYDRSLYRTRNVIERTFNRFKDFRRIATRFDRNVRSYMAALCIVATLVWWV